MSTLRKKAAAKVAGGPMLPPPPPRPFGAPPPPRFTPASHTATPPEECFDDVSDLDVAEDVFRVYRSAGPAAAAASTAAKGGESPAAVMLLHGAGTCAMSWGLCAAELRKTSQVVAVDLRGHGHTRCKDGTDLSAGRLCADIAAVMAKVFTEGQRVLLVGHSLGGALAVHLAGGGGAAPELPVKLVGCVVVDVVEGTALESLRHMETVLARRPARFGGVSEVIQWGVSGAGLRNLASARASMPPQVVEVEEGKEGGELRWRTDLLATEPFWEGWFLGMSTAFMSSPCPKLLLLAGTDRLDKELAIGHMQGKFQMTVVTDCGHFMQEDRPEEIAAMINGFLRRFTAALPKVADFCRKPSNATSPPPLV